MSALYFTSTFISKMGNVTYEVNIKAKTLTAGNDTEFKLTSQGFKLKYAKGKDTKLAGIKPSTLSFGFIVENETDKDQLNTILATPEGEYYIEVKKGSVVYWTGWLKPAYDNFNDSAFPYVINIKATDSLGRLLNKYNNAIQTDGAADYKDLYNPLDLFFNTFDLTSLPLSGYKVATLFRWWPANLAYSTSVNAMRKLFYNRNSYVSDAVNYGNVIKNYLTELKGVYKPFNLKTIYAENKYWLIQDNALDDPDPYIWVSDTPGPAPAFEFRINNQVGIQPLSIDNSQPLSGLNGIMKAGAQFRYDPELNSVRGKYVKGNTFATFDTENPYSSFTTIGFVEQGQTQLNLNLNVQIVDKWLSSAVTPHTNQSSYLTGLVTCKIRVGNKYLSSNGIYNSSSTMGWEWNTNSGSTFSFAVGLGSTATASVENWTLSNLGFLTTYAEDTPTGYDTAKANILVQNLALPPLDVYGECQFTMSGAIIYWQLPSATIVYNPDDYFTNIFADLATNQMPGSTGLNNTDTPDSRTLTLLTTPLLPNIQNGDIGTADNPSGTSYFAAVTPTTPNIDKSLGDFILGNTDSVDASVNTIRLIDGTDYANTGGFAVEDDTNYKNLTQLLLNEYLRISNKPTILVQGTIINGNYIPTKPILYADEIGGDQSTFIFVEGTFTAAKDEWAGTWYKLDKSDDTFTEVEDPTYTDPEGGELTGAGGAGFVSNPNTFQGLPQQNLSAANSIATLTTAIAPSTAVTSIQVAGLKTALKDGQHIFIMNQANQNAMQIATTDKAAKGATTIDTSFTSIIGYDIGSKICIATYDIPNYFSPNLAPGVTSTAVYISPQQFHTTNDSDMVMYSRDDLGSIQGTEYSRKTIYATTFIPGGFKVTALDVYASQNRGIEIKTCRVTDDTTTSRGTGTANTPLILSPAWTNILGEYVIVMYKPESANEEIYGAKITIQEV